MKSDNSGGQNIIQLYAPVTPVETVMQQASPDQTDPALPLLTMPITSLQPSQTTREIPLPSPMTEPFPCLWQMHKGNRTIYEYDTMNRLIKETDPLGNTKTYSYKEVGVFFIGQPGFHYMAAVGRVVFLSHGMTSFRLPHDSGGMSGASRKAGLGEGTPQQDSRRGKMRG